MAGAVPVPMGGCDREPGGMAGTRFRKRVRSAVVWVAGLVFAKVTLGLPLRVDRMLGRRLGRLAYHVAGRTRRIGRANLDQVFGDTLSRRRKTRILKASAENVGIGAAEFSHIKRMDDGFIEKQVAIENAGVIDKTRGGVVISAHLGNWEWLGRVWRSLGLDTCLVVRRFSQPGLEALIDSTRRSAGVDTIDRRGAVAEAVRIARQGWHVVMLADQAPRGGAVPVQFMGRPCWGCIGPAVVALRARVPIYPVSLTRDDTGKYLFEIQDPIELAPSRNLRARVVDATQQCQDAVETMVRRHPEQWVWSQRRWRRRSRHRQGREADPARKGLENRRERTG